MRKRLKEIYDHSTLVAKIRYSYLCLLVPFVLFLIFCFYNLWNNNRRYEDMVNSSVMASQFSLDFQKDFDYETYLLIVGNKTLEESSLHAMLEEADEIVAGLEELTESQENRKRLTSVKKYLNNLGTYIGRIEDNIREGNRYEDNIEIWENGHSCFYRHYFKRENTERLCEHAPETVLRYCLRTGGCFRRRPSRRCRRNLQKRSYHR